MNPKLFAAAPNGQAFAAFGASFALDHIHIDAGASPDIRLQGNVDLLNVAGLQIGVTGSNYVQFDSSGNLTLTGVSATLNGSATIAGATFSAKNLTVSYTPNPTSGGPNEFQIIGTTSVTVANVGTINVDWGNVATQTAGLVYQDGSLKSINMIVTGNVTVDSVTFSGGLGIAYNANDTKLPTPGPDFAMTGTATLSDTSGDSIKVNLGGPTFDGSGTTQGLVIVNGALASLNMAVTGQFTKGNVTFQTKSLTVAYTPASSTFTMKGAASFTYGAAGTTQQAVGVQFGGFGADGTPTQGLTIVHGVLTQLEVALTGNMSLFGLTIAPKALTFVYAAGPPDLFEMYGSLSFSTNDASFQGVTATLGTTQTPGLVISNGTLQSFNIGIDGGFKLGQFAVQAQGLTVAYGSTTGIVGISGMVSTTFGQSNVTIILPSPGVTINTSTGDVILNSLALSVTDFPVGPITVQSLLISYDNRVTCPAMRTSSSPAARNSPWRSASRAAS